MRGDVTDMLGSISFDADPDPGSAQTKWIQIQIMKISSRFVDFLTKGKFSNYLSSFFN